MPNLVVHDVPDELKKKFKAACSENSTTMTAVLIKVMRQVTGDSEEPGQKITRENQVNLRLTDEELNELLIRQEREGDAVRTVTAINAMRRGMGFDPILNRDLVTALRESNRELTAIGRNLNQVARVLNTDPRMGENVRHDSIVELVQTIEAHRQHVAKLVKRSLGRDL